MKNILNKKTENYPIKKLDWNKVQLDMKEKLGNDIYESWLKKIDFIDEFNNYILISVSTRFIRDWITSRYLDQILQIVKTHKKEISRIEFTINDQLGHLIDGGENLIIDIDSAVCDIINCTETLSINKLLPQQFILESNYPNPYNPQTVIRYSVAQIADVTLEIFDIRGNLIAELISKIHSPGQYSILWNASSVAAGLYFVEMKAYSNNTQLIFKEINKMLFLK